MTETLDDCIFLCLNLTTHRKDCFLGKTCFTDATACGDYEPEGEIDYQ